MMDAWSSDGPGSENWSGAGASAPGPAQEIQDMRGMRPDGRMARKAELARESRKRKKAYIQNLQEKAATYAAKVEALEKRQARTLANLGLSSVGKDEKERRQVQRHILEKMLVNLSTDTKDKNKELEALMTEFTENSRARQSRVDSLFEMVEESLAPGLQAKMALWVLSQDDKFYDESTFWPSLAYRELGLSAEQAEELKEFRKETIARREGLQEIMTELGKLKSKTKAQVKSLNAVFDRLQSHLNPEQRAKFAVWVAKNKWCMEMMSALWGKQ